MNLWLGLRLRAMRRTAAVGMVGVVLLAAGCSTNAPDVTAQWSAEKLYAEAKDEIAAGNYERAGKLLERLEGRAAGTALAQQAQVERAWVLYRTGEKAEALAVLERFIKLNPSSPGLPYAYYLQGLVNFNDNLGLFGSLASQNLSERDQQASRDSYQSFRAVVEQFPTSVYAEDARLRMNYIVNALADYEVHVARYYYRRGAYVAAANRAQQAVQEFQTSPAAKEALQIMVASYDRLGLVDLRDDARRVLERSFPDGAAGAAGDTPGKKAWWRFW